MRARTSEHHLTKVLALGLLVPSLLGSSKADEGAAAEDGAGHVSPGKASWLVVTAPAFREVIEPLVARRRAEGFNVSVLQTTDVLTEPQTQSGQGGALRARLSELLRAGQGTNYVLLAGVMLAQDRATARRIVVPALVGTTGRMKDQPGDRGYALPASNGSARVAVGRFPARTVEEMRGMVQKTIRFEEGTRKPDAWRDRMVLVQGNPDGGSLAEMLIEQLTAPRLEKFAPTWTLHAVADNPSSRFHVPRQLLHDAALGLLQEGQLFSVYLGHSSARGLWSGKSYFLTCEDLAKLRIRSGQGVLFSCGCFACQTSLVQGDGYGLAAIRNPDGPVAVIGAEGESYSAPGLLALDGFLGCCSAGPFPERLGDYWLAVQAGLAQGAIDRTTFALCDQFDGTGGKVPLEVQRREHLEMWVLLGDPALHLPLLAEDIVLRAGDVLVEGQTFHLSGELPQRLSGATIRVTLERTLASRPSAEDTGGAAGKQPAPASREATGRNEQMVASHQRVNQTVLVTANATGSGRRFSCTLVAPAKLPWPKAVVRVYAEKGSESAQGVLAVAVKH